MTIGVFLLVIDSRMSLKTFDKTLKSHDVSSGFPNANIEYLHSTFFSLLAYLFISTLFKKKSVCLNKQ